MLNTVALQELQENPFFAAWDHFIPTAALAKAEDSMQTLIARLLVLDPEGSETEVMLAVSECVIRFNEIDTGWITSIEREDICDALSRIVEICGMDGSADWIVAAREW